MLQNTLFTICRRSQPVNKTNTRYLKKTLEAACNNGKIEAEYPLQTVSKTMPTRRARWSNLMSFFNLHLLLAPRAPHGAPGPSRSIFVSSQHLGIVLAVVLQRSHHKSKETNVPGRSPRNIMREQQTTTPSMTKQIGTHLRQYKKRTQARWRGCAKPSGYN